MNTRERFVGTLTGRPVDRVPFIKVFGGDNAMLSSWATAHPEMVNQVDRTLQFEGTYRGWATTPVNFWLVCPGEPVVLEENGTHRVTRFPDGSVQRTEKGCDFHRQTLEWPVKTRADWARVKSRYLQADDPSRFPADWSRRVEEYRNRDYPLQLTHGGVYGFVRNLMGDEQLLYTFYDDPDLVHDMMDTYTGMVLQLWEKMVADVSFDLIEFWEDMASKNGPLLSPDMFREFMTPNYRRVAAFAKAHGIEILLVDSDGYIDDLTDVMVESGITAMYPFEIGAGCNVLKTRERHPSLGIIGGLNKQVMAHNRAAIDKEVEKAREYIRRGRYIPGPDHFVLSDVTWENYRYFMERLREVVLTTQPGG